MSIESNNGQIPGFFSKHCVPLYVSFSKGEECHHYIFSSFVVSIDDEWFLITAGHCLRKIEDCIKKGYSIKSRLVDSTSLDSFHENSIPFDYEAALTAHLDDDKFDYGIIHITHYYRSLLESNNVMALNEEVWEKQPHEPDFYCLLGAPDQLKELVDEPIRFTMAFLKVKECPSAEKEFEPTNAPTFYGEIHLEENLSSIVGMSGGPVFSFKRTEVGELKYWLCAVQSRWLSSKRLIAACLIKPFALELRDIMRGAWQKNA